MLACRLLERPAWHFSAVRTVRTKARPRDALVQPGSIQHNDVASFLKYSESNSLSPSSTVFKGTLYEYTVIESLRHFGFDLTRTGKRSDLGIDLLGHWTIPSLPIPLRALLQCKAHSKKLNPDTVRELEGAFVGAPAGFRGEGVLGFLVAAESATKGMRDALIRSELPLAFLQINRDGIVEQFLWNHIASHFGLEGLGVTTKHLQPAKNQSSKPSATKEIALTWNGWEISKVGDERKTTAKAKGSQRRQPSMDDMTAEKRSRGRPRKSAAKAKGAEDGEQEA